MKLYYRIYNEVRVDGGVSWYADKYHKIEWTWDIAFLLIQVFFINFGWQPLASFMDGEAKEVGKTEDDARKVCEADAASIARSRQAYRDAIVQKTSKPIAFYIEIP